jgi:hypothetical protein
MNIIDYIIDPDLSVTEILNPSALSPEIREIAIISLAKTLPYVANNYGVYDNNLSNVINKIELLRTIEPEVNVFYCDLAIFRPSGTDYSMDWINYLQYLARDRNMVYRLSKKGNPYFIGKDYIDGLLYSLRNKLYLCWSPNDEYPIPYEYNMVLYIDS